MRVVLFSFLVFISIIKLVEASWASRRPNVLPPPSTPTIVDVGVYVVDFGGLAAHSDDSFRLDAWVIFRWHDHRLNATQDGEYDMKSSLWLPWLPPWHIVNRRADGWEESNHIYVKNQTVEWFQRMYGMFHSPMDFTAFPFDAQSFVLKIEPDYFSNVMQFRAWEEPTGMSNHKTQTNSVGLSAWELGTPRKLYLYTHAKHVLTGSDYQGLCHNADDSFYEDRIPYSDKMRMWADGVTFDESGKGKDTQVFVQHVNNEEEQIPKCYTKSRIEFMIQAQRRVLKIAWSYFIPVHLVIILSWSSFVLPLDASPTRVSLSLLTMLTYEVKGSYVKDLFPDVSYTTWILVHNILCLSTLFCIVIVNVLLYAISHMISNRLAKSLNRVAQVGIGVLFVSMDSVLFGYAEGVQGHDGWCRMASVCCLGAVCLFIFIWVQYASWLRYNLFQMLATPVPLCRYLVFKPLATCNDLDDNEVFYIWRKLALGRLSIQMNSDSQEESVQSSVLLTGVGLLCPWIDQSYLVRLRRWLDRSERCQRGAAVPFSFFKRHYRRILMHNVLQDDDIFHHKELPGSPSASDAHRGNEEIPYSFSSMAQFLSSSLAEKCTPRSARSSRSRRVRRSQSDRQRRHGDEAEFRLVE